MGHAVQLLLGATSRERVLALWQLLADEGVSSLLPDLGSVPHISLAVFDDLEVERILPVLADFARETSSVPITFAAAAAFPGDEGVVYLAPVVTGELLDAHEDFHARLAATDLECHPCYRPGSWVPHCTVGQDLPAGAIATALDHARRANVFGPAELDALTLVAFRPVVTLKTIALAKRGGAGAPDHDSSGAKNKHARQDHPHADRT